MVVGVTMAKKKGKEDPVFLNWVYDLIAVAHLFKISVLGVGTAYMYL